MDFEKALLNDIPTDEASAFFLKVTGRDKVATANLESAWDDLSPEEQDQILKEAQELGLLTEDQLPKEANALMGYGGGGGAGPKMGAPPVPASMPAQSPVQLPATAQGMNSVKTAMRKAAEHMKIAISAVPQPQTSPSDPDEPNLEEYLAAEQAGMAAEEEQSAEFYRQRLQEARQQLDDLSMQAEQTGQKAQELEAQVAQNDQQVQAAMQQAQMASQSAMANVQQAHEMAMNATNQAMESQAEVLRQKQLAAAMRMGVQTLKDNVMGAMAQDPTDELAKQLQAPPPGSAGMVGGQPPPPPAPIDPMTGQPMAPMPGDPNAAAAAGGAPAEGGPPAGGEKKPSSSSGEKKPEKKESKSESKSEKKDGDKKDGGTHVEVKTGSASRFLAAVSRMKKAV